MKKKNLSEYKWVQDAIEKMIETPETEQEQAVIEFMRKKVKENREDESDI